MQDTCLIYIVSQVLKVLLLEKVIYMIQSVLLFLVVLLWLLYTLADTFLELQSLLLEKMFLSQILLF